MDEASAHVPRLSPLSNKLTAQAPQLGMNMFAVDVNAITKDATDLMSWIGKAQKEGKSRSLMTRFDDEWNALHDEVQNETVHEEPAPEPESLCWAAGLCTCDQNGKALKKMVNSILLCMKMMYPRTNPKLNAMLGNSNIFMHISGCTISSLLNKWSPLCDSFFRSTTRPSVRPFDQGTFRLSGCSGTNRTSLPVRFRVVATFYSFRNLQARTIVQWLRDGVPPS